MKKIGYIGVGILGLVIGGFVAPLIFPNQELEDLRLAIDAEKEINDSLRTEISKPRYVDIPGLIPEAVTPVTQATANTYLANYQNWRNTFGGDHKTKGYNLNNSTLDAIGRTLSGLSSDPAVKGTRAMFGLTVPVNTTTIPNGTMKLLIYPLDGDGELISLPSGINVFMADLSGDYTRPCPPYCD